jgi:hypothetical protein
MASTLADTTEADAWLKLWTIPEEDRAKYTSEPWRGEARWFRSRNVVPLEAWRRQRAHKAAVTTGEERQ